MSDVDEGTQTIAWNRFQKALNISKQLMIPGGIQSMIEWEELFSPLESYPVEIPPDIMEDIKASRIRVLNAAAKNAGYETVSDATWKYVKELTNFALTSGPLLRIAIGSFSSLLGELNK